MKLQNFKDLGGDTDLARLQNLFSQSDRGYIYGQEKLNGVFAHVSVDQSNADLIIRTKDGKQWPQGFFSYANIEGPINVLAILGHDASLFCELYIPGVHLATLAGWVNVNSARAADAFRAHGRFMIFDVQTHKTAEYEYRMQTLERLIFQGRAISTIPALQLRTPDEADKFFTAQTADKEGVIYRLPNSLSTSSAIKRKHYHEAEFLCVAVTEGKGKRKGMLGSLTLKDPATNKTFKCGGGTGLTDAQLLAYFQHPPIGQPITVRYDEISINGLPLRPQIVTPRNYE